MLTTTTTHLSDGANKVINRQTHKQSQTLDIQDQL